MQWDNVLSSVMSGSAVSSLNIMRDNWVMSHMVRRDAVSSVNNSVMVLNWLSMMSWGNMMRSCMVRNLMVRCRVMDWLCMVCELVGSWMHNSGMVSNRLRMMSHHRVVSISSMTNLMVWSWGSIVSFSKFCISSSSRSMRWKTSFMMIN